MSADTIHKIQGRLLTLAALFLGLFAIALTLSPAARAHSWQTDYRWSHWLGYMLWLGGFWVLHRSTKRWLPQRDPYLIPLIAFISGWGLLTIWRLTTYYGMRQTIWLALAFVIFILGLRLPSDLEFLRRYKYLWLTSGLLLTGLTLIFGTNPMGFGPRLWLGCCGVYLQPSEPLKLLLIVFLAAYFADQWNLGRMEIWKKGSILSSNLPIFRRYNVLIPTIIMTGLALLMLIVQRDLGTASLFIFIYAVMVYLATSWRGVPVITVATLAAAGALGYLLFDVVRLRIEAWLNPWLDPTGRSFQIVQSLMAVANGGVFGRGPGMGSPTLVPVSHSDFIFAAISEETGMLGAFGLLIIMGLLVHRGIRIALLADDTFCRLLSAGLTAFLVGQSVLIIGGNLRLLPLTGVTLPFVSYGGSSLIVSFIVGLLLLLVSATCEGQNGTQPHESNLREVSRSSLIPLTSFLLLALGAVSLAVGWWAYVRGPDLLTRTDNPRRAISDRYVYRGALISRGGNALAETTGQPGGLSRSYIYPALGPVTGYNHPVYGQAGLEASLDPTLRGVEGNDAFTIWWHHLLYGQPPPGQDVRLTLDLELQNLADDLLNDHNGALVLLNAKTGEILVMASHPSFDPNQLDDTWDNLIRDPLAPLINRTTQGSYPTGDLTELPFMLVAANPEVERISLRLPLADTAFPEESTPLETAFAAASLSNDGVRPAARLALSYQHPHQGWLTFPPLGVPIKLFTPMEINAQISAHQDLDLSIWQIATIPKNEALTWYLAGTLPGHEFLSSGQSPLTLALVLEEKNLPLAEKIGQALIMEVLSR
jgi:cell division protein FtsW (lipid II flippase)